MKVKKCWKCGDTKDKKEFNRNEKRKDGCSVWCKKCNKEYRWLHREHYAELSKKWHKTHKKKAKEQCKSYSKTHREEINQWKKSYRKTNKGREITQKCKSNRRGLGHIALNKPFPGCHFHHVTNNKGVNIQDKVHKMFFGYDRKTHRRLVLAYYGSLKKMILNAKQLKLF